MRTTGLYRFTRTACPNNDGDDRNQCSGSERARAARDRAVTVVVATWRYERGALLDQRPVGEEWSHLESVDADRDLARHAAYRSRATLLLCVVKSAAGKFATH